MELKSVVRSTKSKFLQFQKFTSFEQESAFFFRELYLIAPFIIFSLLLPKCPTCGSTNIRKMGGVERGASIWAFGIFSKKINKTFKCGNCGYTW